MAAPKYKRMADKFLKEDSSSEGQVTLSNGAVHIDGISKEGIITCTISKPPFYWDILATTPSPKINSLLIKFLMSLGQKKMKLISCKWLCVIAFGLVAFIIGFGGGYLVHVQPRTSKASSTTAPTQPTPSGPNTTIPAETTTTRAPAGECWKEIHWMILSHSHLLNLVNSMKSLKSLETYCTRANPA